MKLYDCVLFRGVPPEVIDKLVGTVHYQKRKCPKGAVVVQSGDECAALLIVVLGSVRGEMFDFSGKTIKIEDIESPQALAPAFLFGKQNRYPVTIIANCDAELLVFPKASVLAMLQANNQFLVNYLNSISNRAQFLSEKLRFLSFHTIKGKLAYLLLELEKTQGRKVTLPKSQQELSAMFGVARPSLARAMRELHNEGLVNAQGKAIELVDRDALVALTRS